MTTGVKDQLKDQRIKKQKELPALIPLDRFLDPLKPQLD